MVEFGFSAWWILSRLGGGNGFRSGLLQALGARVSRRESKKIRVAAPSAPQSMTMLEVTGICPMVTMGLTMAPARNADAPKMADAAPALCRSVSIAVAVSPGWVSPKLKRV